MRAPCLTRSSSSESRDAHCIVRDGWPEIETIYRAYQVLLLKPAPGSASKRMCAGAKFEGPWCRQKNQGYSLPGKVEIVITARATRLRTRKGAHRRRRCLPTARFACRAGWRTTKAATFNEKKGAGVDVKIEADPMVSTAINPGCSPPPRRPLWSNRYRCPASGHRDYFVVFAGSAGDAGRTNLASSTGTFWLSSLT